MAATLDEPAGRRAVPQRWLLIGAGVLLIVLLIVGYFAAGSALASSAATRADAALNTVQSSRTSIAGVFANDPFKTVVFNAQNPNVDASKQALTQMRAQLEAWQAQINRNRQSLQKVRSDLNGSILTMPEQSTFDSRSRRVNAALSALQSAQDAVRIQQKQVAFLTPLLDVIAGFIDVGKASDAHDINAMVTALNSSEAAVGKTVTASYGVDVPPMMTFAVNELQKTVQDMKALVKAAVANETAAANAALSQVDLDTRTIAAIDPSNIQESERLEFKPLSDSFTSQMALAGKSS